MAIQDVWLQIESIEEYNPVINEVDCMRNSGHESGTIGQSEVNSRKLRALVFREYTDGTYTVMKLNKLIISDVNEPNVNERIGTVIYTTPGTTLKIHVRNFDHEPHSFHVHGLSYGIESDGAWPFGVTNSIGQRSDEICNSEIWTYKFNITDEMIGCWPFHDHYRDILGSVNSGLFGGIIVVPALEPPWIPPSFEIPQFLVDALDNPQTNAQTRLGINTYLLEMAESPLSQPEIQPTDVIHAPIFFHTLGDSHNTSVFNTGRILPGQNATILFNFVNTDTDLYYHCTLHLGMFGKIKVRQNSLIQP